MAPRIRRILRIFDLKDSLRDEAELQDDREMAVYLMAYDYALNKEYPEAISIFNSLPKDSRWADQRPRIIGIWQKKQADEEKAADMISLIEKAMATK